MKIGRALLGLDEHGNAFLGSLEFLGFAPKMMAWPNVSQIDSGEEIVAAEASRCRDHESALYAQ